MTTDQLIFEVLRLIVVAVASVMTTVIAVAAWFAARKTFRTQYRPIVRVVATYEKEDDSTAPDAVKLDTVKLKNIGGGHAITVIVFDPAASEIMGTIDSIGPLGAGAEERVWLGNVTLRLSPKLTFASLFDLYYQDILGRWHVTHFRLVADEARIRCSFPGVVKPKKVPAEIKHLALVGSTS